MAERELIVFIILINIVLFVFIIGVVFFVIQYKKRKQLHGFELKRIREDFANELLKIQLDAQKDTMVEIGKEIHDSLGQKLSLASIYLHKVVIDIKEIKVEQIDEINAILDESLIELRQISTTLIKEDATKVSLEKLVINDISRIQQLNDIVIDCDINADLTVLSSKQTLMLRRLIQEFLQNSIKHSKANNIKLNFSRLGKDLVLVCSDNGIGFDINSTKRGNGLNNIESRLKDINAVYCWGKSDQNGVELHIKLQTII